MSSEPPPLPESARPQRALRMAWQTIDGETVLLDVDGKELLGLNEVGARVWALCDGEHALSAIVEAIAAEFEVDRATAEADVRAFVSELLAQGALEPRR